MTATLLLLAPVGVGLSISAADVLRVLPYPAAFAHAAPALALLALAVPVTGMLMVLSTLAVASGQERAWLKISAFAVCIFPPLYVGLIWWFQRSQANGATGAAVANLIGEAMLVVWAWLVLPGRVRQTTFLRQAPQVLVLTLVMGGVVAFLQRLGVPLPAYIPIGALIYGVGVWLLRLVTPDDVALVRRAVGRRRRRAAEPSRGRRPMSVNEGSYTCSARPAGACRSGPPACSVWVALAPGSVPRRPPSRAIRPARLHHLADAPGADRAVVSASQPGTGAANLPPDRYGRRRPHLRRRARAWFQVARRPDQVSPSTASRGPRGSPRPAPGQADLLVSIDHPLAHLHCRADAAVQERSTVSCSPTATTTCPR